LGKIISEFDFNLIIIKYKDNIKVI